MVQSLNATAIKQTLSKVIFFEINFQSICFLRFAKIININNCILQLVCL